MIWAIMADAIVTYILFLRFQEFQEIRGRLLPLCILTSVHTILIPVFFVFTQLIVEKVCRTKKS